MKNQGWSLFLSFLLGFNLLSLQAQHLLDIDFGIGMTSLKKGIAAAGQTPGDYWNLYSRDDGHGGYRTYGTVTNLLWADGVASGITVTVSNAPGAWGTGSTDPMFATYLYPFNQGNILITLSGVPASHYDVYLYGHGLKNTENGSFTIDAGAAHFGPEMTATASGWNTTTWVEGQQFAVFRDLAVAPDQPLLLTVSPGMAGDAVINGLQLVERPTTANGPALIDIQFTADQNWAFTNKVGFAAIGLSTNDYWNVYSRDDGHGGFRPYGQLSNLKFADGRNSSVTLSVSNAPGFWYTYSLDPMMAGYLYPLGPDTNIYLTLAQLPAGAYSFYVYAHGLPDQQNGVVQLRSGATDYGQKATTTLPGWDKSTWAAGKQYVLFDNVTVADDAPVRVTLLPGAGNLAVLNGLQIIPSTNATPASLVTRELPAGYLPGTALTVTLVAHPPARTSAYAVEDQPPPNWVITSVSSDGAIDTLNHLVKFGPFLDSQSRTLTYVVTPPTNAVSTAHFSGVASFDGADGPIGGDQDIAPGIYHPADDAPADWRITVSELTAYAAAWRRGDRWPQPPNPIPIGYVTRAALLWKAGEFYRYDGSGGGAPLYWVSATQANVKATTAVGIGKSRRQGNVAVSSPASQAVAVMASQYQSHQALVVSIEVNPAPGVAAYAVEDQPPAGWTVNPVLADGIYDPVTGKVKWGPYLDNQPRTLSYSVTPPATANSRAAFSGIVSFDGGDVAVTGQRTADWSGSGPLWLGAVVKGPRVSSFEVAFGGNPGQVYRLESSEDLIHWQLVESLTNVTGNLTYTDPDAVNHARRFYRLAPP